MISVLYDDDDNKIKNKKIDADIYVVFLLGQSLVTQSYYISDHSFSPLSVQHLV